ncbi:MULTISPECIES: peptidoglycan DD-metalloendopeptidase family protein [unclassified Moritella]|uniref:peptidoglycan DD-metalloendopeptidase family protein n=1 Tax=unclassified Moritella TaxID=2637987 RepID=UPI001BA72E53|nr:MULTISPECIES: peptidoglycan DD-metalloendopeptidase family protein [unclassified Moritella]QUM83763.1 peptidoglycan DD-metalloendopeptidase family protein [Moritella sp. 28]QUM88053.1 peptidoglycan DD-metalloendopeptidase family protein [Moritella sp. 36]
MSSIKKNKLQLVLTWVLLTSVLLFIVALLPVTDKVDDSNDISVSANSVTADISDVSKDKIAELPSESSPQAVLLDPAATAMPADSLLTDDPRSPLYEASAANATITESAVAEIAEDLAKSYPKTINYVIQKGDTLGAIFEQLDLSQTSLYQILEVDLNVLALDSIKPGQTLAFTEFEGELTRLELQVSLGHQVVYKRLGESGFEFEEINVDGEWRDHSYIGTVENSFSGSAKQAGLSLFEAQFIATLLKDKINFSRDLRSGDTFKVLVSRQYIGDQLTGENRIDAVSINNRNRDISAYLYEGSYYDEAGLSIERAFVRRPVSSKYRISSSFNPRRVHPVTGLLRPHNGTDFATPIGTSVYATGDGIVSRVVNHKYAGLYIEISNGQTFRTRFLHLSKALVRKGQRIKRGQKIALSGNSGRVTGPHLHYELHMRGRAVNAMTADIPIASAIDKRQQAAFKLALNGYHAAWEQAKS